ncbi:DNA replication/repair protein RecF [Denitrobacterium detoxificans]|jgi:DNA replication and repair protein RecF|uniref:DNA replication/repair protein RecF n=1 Tax=Denitrobacterium detoxificans TaxID=79604 RepID=UPI0026E94962|nr:DNA replication/repair protein RecF [Denitrobacterium detoxificans]MBE6466397.1 DNA replication/repair protein RecF [Denitrobacterium detoxificans]
MAQAEYSASQTPGMRLSRLSLRDFRNYRSFDLSNIGALTILVGPNAVGKTSAVEGISLLTACSSFRTTQAAQMIKWGCETAQLEAQFQSETRKVDMGLTISAGRRSYRMNGKPRKAADVRGLVPAVSFTPDDLHLAKGAASARRDAIDSVGVQLSRNFYSVCVDYRKLVKQKNQALKDELPDAYIESLNDVLVRVGVQVLMHRLQVLDRLRPHFQSYYREITGGGEEADVLYAPCWAKDAPLEPGVLTRNDALAQLTSYMASRAVAERARKRCLVGPHADAVTFTVEGHDAAHFASQGQQRSIVLAWKLAEAAVIASATGNAPLLLLDDVMSELDDARRSYFMNFIAGDTQAFITTTHTDYFTSDMLARADIIALDGSEAFMGGARED